MHKWLVLPLHLTPHIIAVETPEITSVIVTSTFRDMITTAESLSSPMINPNTDEPIEMQVTSAPPIVTPRTSPGQNSPSRYTLTDVLQGEPGSATDQRSRSGPSSVSQASPEPRSLHNTLTKCIPENSDMMRSIRARKPNALLVNETHPEGLRWRTRNMDHDLKKLHDNPLGQAVVS